MVTEKKAKLVSHDADTPFGIYLQNATGGGVLKTNIKPVPRSLIGLELFGEINKSGNASPVTCSITYPICLTVKFFGQVRCTFICAGGRTAETTNLGISSIMTYLTNRIPGSRFQVRKMKINNKLHTTKVGYLINLKELYPRLLEQGFEVSYAPEKFVGLSIRFVLPRTEESMTFTVFSSGALNLTGCRDSHHATLAVQYILPYLAPSFGDPVNQEEEAEKKYKKLYDPAKRGQRRKPGGSTAPRICSFPLFEAQLAEFQNNNQNQTSHSLKH